MRNSEYPQLNDRDWLAQRYAECQSTPLIAEEIGCHYTAVNRALRRHDIEVIAGRPLQRSPLLDDPVWLAEQVKTKTIVALAKELGCSRPTVRTALKRHNIVTSASTANQKRSESLRRTLAKRYPNGRRGPLASNWRGGRIERDGYIWLYAPDHPRAKAQGNQYVQEHILVAEEKLGRPLRPEERVHHNNHDKTDNRPENLIVKTRGRHVRDHFTEARNLQAVVAALEAENRALRESQRLRQILDEHGIPYPKPGES